MIYTDFTTIPRLKYDVIMADCPWHFKQFSAKGYEKNAAKKYAVMNQQDIANLPVHELANKDCLLWMWATNPMLPNAIAVMHAWGFTYKTSGHWVKRTTHGKLAFGTGYILRGAGEPFLIGTIGKPKTSRSVRSVIEAKVREHSRKPDEAYDALEKLVPHATQRLDMFSREVRDGWDQFGNEVGVMNDRG